ncbi:flagellar type III secretion system pore protein FliP [Sedimentibacter sp. zth1]|uniref:flagellar type III secretion system pore protein FliP n=1 Tax=Sedimentibacter sp. zth1 TaxID=2816908 RepID=UPI001A933A0B|nr:flagellar type III secretion system pore protein FliP [Sedimentibacter sp. zth1]QSX07187.1 flagellar type III secretion system pore protein FliP [Sedimentibacter sp. zth1]
MRLINLVKEQKRKCSFKIILIALMLIVVTSVNVYAGVINVDVNGTKSDTLEIIILMTVLALLPSIIIMMTSFTRIIIVMSFLRNALGIQQTPPNQVLVGIALFLTLFIMMPVIKEINTTAYEPYKSEEISQEEFYEKAAKPIKEFMLKQTGKKELDMFITLSKDENFVNDGDFASLPMTVVIPAFMTSELRRAFIIGFLLFIPFLIIDIIVSTVLMSMGMMMLPPIMISLPFKILLFVLVDGWSLLFKTLVMSFNI